VSERVQVIEGSTITYSVDMLLKSELLVECVILTAVGLPRCLQH